MAPRFSGPPLRILLRLAAFLGACVLGAGEGPEGSELGQYAVSCPEGFGDLVDPGYFEVFGNWQERYGRDNLRLSAHFLEIFRERIEPVLAEALDRCPAFVLEVMMNAVLKIDTDEGGPLASDWLRRIYELRAHAAVTASAVSQERLRRLDAEWAVDIAAVYPKFLGLGRLGPLRAADASDAISTETAAEAAFCEGQRFYVYDLGQHFYRPGTLYCLQGQWGTEVIMHHYLRRTCNTQDPELADWFYVPLYGTCMYVKLNENVSDDGGTQDTMDELSDRHIWEPVLTFLRSSRYWHRKQGSDHIFLFADGQGPRIWDAFEAIRSESVFLSPESKCPTWGEPVRRYLDVKPCLSGWKDIIIPGHTDYARIEYMRKQNRPPEERRLLMTFHGRGPGLHGAYGSCAVRGRIMELARHGPHVDVGGFVGDYPERKGDSHFCLVPAGTSPWTNHLYESFYAGCLPVILSDEYEVAFQDYVDWPSFSIKWPETAVGDSLYEYLRDLVEYYPQRVAAMKASLERNACWFNWYSRDIACSPYLLIQRRLRELLRTRRSRLRFWGHDVDMLGLASEPPLVFAHLGRPTRFSRADNETSAFGYLRLPAGARAVPGSEDAEG